MSGQGRLRTAGAEPAVDPSALASDDDRAAENSPFDQSAAIAFCDRVQRDGAAAVAAVLCVMGDRLGLFDELAAGPATPAELAGRSGVAGRYAREWLCALTAHGYLRHDPTTDRFSVPPAHAPVLSRTGPWSLAGGFQTLGGLLPMVEAVTDAFQTGRGVDQAAYGDDVFAGMARITASGFEQRLVEDWLPQMPDVEQRLLEGAKVADIGCGEGVALITMATRYPKCAFVGYDQLPGVVEAARRKAESVGVSDRVSFRAQDATTGLREQFDVITTFDVVHDAADPIGLLSAIRRALAPDGTYLLLEVNCGDRVEDNTGPIATRAYGISVLYCLSVSLAAGGPGLGTFGMPEPVVRSMCEQAGFGAVRRLRIENPFNILYAVKK